MFQKIVSCFFMMTMMDIWYKTAQQQNIP